MSFILKSIGFSSILFFYFILTSKPISGKIFDQILAVVDDQLITQGDLRIQTLFSLEFPLLEENKIDSHLQFAIDQILFLEDAEKFATDKPTEPEIDEVFNKLETSAGTSEKLDSQLAQVGINRDDLKNLANRFLLSKKFIDQRVNYFIFISDNEIDSYYNDHLSDWNGDSLDSVRNTIYSLLFEQKRKVKLEDYISKRRSKASIRITPPYSTVLP